MELEEVIEELKGRMEEGVKELEEELGGLMELEEVDREL